MQTEDETCERLRATIVELVVADGANDTFQDEVGELEHELGRMGIELQITGPSPACNFVPDAIGAAW